MDAALSSDSISLVLEEKVNELENKLAHTSQTLKTKDHVLHLQQEQIKKLEDMYKRCLEDVANVTCEHKKTVNDLENLRIILKSYEKERVRSSSDFESQVDLASPRCSEELDKINGSLALQNEKSDRIVELLRSATVEPLEAIRQHVGELQATTDCLLTLSNRRRLDASAVVAVGEDGELETMRILSVDSGNQTALLQADSSTNFPRGTAAASAQAVIDCAHGGTSTCAPPNTCKTIQCQLQTYSSLAVQNTVFDDIVRLKRTLREIQSEVCANESLRLHLETSLAHCGDLVACVNERNAEILELRENLQLLGAFIERESYLTVEQVKDLCRQVTLQTGAECMLLVQENNDLSAHNKMLLREIECLKAPNVALPCVIVELMNQHSQTPLRHGDDQPQSDSYRQRLVDLSKELAEAYTSIKQLKCRNDALESDALSLKDLRELFVALNLENGNLYRGQLAEERSKREEQVSSLRWQVQALETRCARRTSGEMSTSSTQVYGWAPVGEQASVLRAENDELAKRVLALKEELESERVNQMALKELNAMCLKLGQNVNENAAAKLENAQLKQQLDELRRAQCDQQGVRELQSEICKLRADSRELGEGVKQLERIVHLHPKNVGKSVHRRGAARRRAHDAIETDASASSGNTSSNECLRPLLAPLNADSSTDIEELKCLCEDLSARLQHKCMDGSGADNKVELLASLEDDLKVLMKEFLDFKWSSQNEHQKLIMKHADVLSQNEELINCLNQYKSVNESLLQSHYELEKPKSNAIGEHQNLLEDYLRLQEHIECVCPRRLAADCGINTTLLAGDVSDAVRVKMENADLQKQNVKLRQEVDNLLTQVNDQHIVCLKTLQENVEQQTCKHCENMLKTLQTLNVDFSKINEENAQLRAAIGEKECDLEEAHQKCAKLAGDIRTYSQLREDFDLKNKQLVADVKRLQNHLASVNADREALQNELKLLKSHSQREAEESCACRKKAADQAQEISQYRAQISTLQKDHVVMASGSEALKQELNQATIQLKAMHDTKKKVEVDFESYIRTNNLLQQTVNTQNANLKEELRVIKEENARLLAELDDLQRRQTTSKSELFRVVNECANYKVQLENMAKRIDVHMKEHLEYKAEVDEVKRSLQAEISSLRQMLDMQSACPDTFEINHYRDADSVENLKAFINAKEIEIDHLMGQKIQAMEAMGQLTASLTNAEKGAHRDQSQTVRIAKPDNFHGHAKKGMDSAHTQPPRSASLPRMSRSARKTAWDRAANPPESGARPTLTRKPFTHLPAKRRDSLHK